MVDIICGKCNFPIEDSEVGIRHFGTYLAHQEYRCLELSQQQIKSLRAKLEQATAERDAADEHSKSLEGTLHQIERELTVGAAEYVPAIPAACEFAIAALHPEEKD